MPIFSVVDIDENAFAAAYPLVRTAAPDVSAEQWSAYAHKVRIRGGLLGLMGPQSTLFGLLSYRNEESLHHGRIFVVDNFLTFELNRAAPGRQALRDAAEALAREQGCKAIELRLDSRGFAIDRSARARSWLNLDHTLQAVVFAKILDAGCEAKVGRFN
ncbi:MAG: hypothetical protein ABIR25_06465 [Sphingomicrobium sp.]